MATVTNDEPQIEEVYEFLNELRNGGSMNMFQAGPHLQDQFGMTPAEARKVVLAWIKQFGK
jgi:hypothetical protein